MVDFKKLKKDSGKFDMLIKAMESMNKNEYENNSDKFWKPVTDKSGNGAFVIRFLPSPGVDGDDASPWVKLYNHSFQGPTGQWFIDNCLTTKGENCPVCEANGILWNSGLDSDKQVARERKRKLTYISNIYVVSDPSNKDNVGKVFLYRYGKKIFNKLYDAMNPSFEEDKAFNPFDLWEGANFKLRITKVEGYQNYDKSEFAGPSPLMDDDAELEQIWNSEQSLLELVSDSVFKSYEDQKKRLEKVLCVETSKPRTTVEQLKASLPKTTRKTVVEESDNQTDTPFEEDSDDLSFFSKLAEED